MSDPGRNRMRQKCWDTSGSKRYSGFDLLHRFAADEWRKQAVLNKDGVELCDDCIMQRIRPTLLLLTSPSALGLHDGTGGTVTHDPRSTSYIDLPNEPNQSSVRVCYPQEAADM